MTTVLITGCSSGIGRATALRLQRAGHTVYATARRPETLEELAAAGCRTLALDVTDDASRRSAVEAVVSEGQVGALVNNAGYGQYGTVEEVPLDDGRRQLETNVVGLVGLAQLVLPGMRAAGQGRIVNISSMGGRFTLPGGGWYHASKHAVEALSDALRFEVRPFGIAVSLVEPGPIDSPWIDTALAEAGATTGEASPYADMIARMQRLYGGVYGSALSAAPDAVARVVQRAIERRRPRSRYRVTAVARLLIASRRLSSDRVWDAGLRTSMR